MLVTPYTSEEMVMDREHIGTSPDDILRSALTWAPEGKGGKVDREKGGGKLS